VTGDQTWCFQYDTQTRNKAWNGACQAFQHTKIIHKEFVPPGQKVNKEYYMEILSRFFKEFVQ
jgi:hypothetical protein